MTPDEAEAVCKVVRARSGVVIDPSKTYVIETRLAVLARRDGYESLAELVQALSADEALMAAVTETLTHSETCFFRDRTPFHRFCDEMLPQLAARRDRPLRVWSAGCATGQEAYSLAMMIDEAAARSPGLKVELFASDLSERRLEKAQSGLYTQFEVQRGLPIRLLVRHFDREGELWVVSPRLRERIRWRRINLIAELKPVSHFDVIFCRNVLTMLDPALRPQLLERLARALTPDGWLVLGREETAAGVAALEPVNGWAGAFGRSDRIRAAA